MTADRPAQPRPSEVASPADHCACNDGKPCWRHPIGAAEYVPAPADPTLRELEQADPFQPHDHGCHCWPHVSQRAAIEASVQAATQEYRASRPAPADRSTEDCLCGAYHGNGPKANPWEHTDTCPASAEDAQRLREGKDIPVLDVSPLFDAGYDAGVRAMAEADLADRSAEDALRGRLITLAARMVRLEGGCESGHKHGQWHMHQDPYHAIGRQLASEVRALSPSTSPSGPDLTAGQRICPDCGLSAERIGDIHINAQEALR